MVSPYHPVFDRDPDKVSYFRRDEWFPLHWDLYLNHLLIGGPPLECCISTIPHRA